MNAPANPIENEQPGLGVRLPYQLGRFTLRRELGAGGMATVYLGRMRMTEGFDRLVALKTIHGHLARAQTFVDMFLDEAKIASQISHPNVCSVYDFGNLNGTYYLALEYLTGEPLHEVIERIVERESDDLMQALPYIAARILADACEGLHAAHETRGSDGTRLDIIHRDVSPQNLFVTYDGAVKVVDFGCAKAIERVTQTDTGVMKGKVSYAAPEQLRAGHIDQRVDVWALGVCLWETLTLKDLFRRDTAILSAMAVLEEPIPRADEGRAWVPRKLADIAEKALQRDPEKRYRSARELGRDLRAFIARAGVSFESAELAEWMDYLFAERQREVRAMVAEVEATTTTTTAPASGRRDASVGEAATKLAKLSTGSEGQPWFEEVDASAERPKRALRLDPEPDDPVVLPTRSRAWLWALLLLLLAGGGVAGLRHAGLGPFAPGGPLAATSAIHADVADPPADERAGTSPADPATGTAAAEASTDPAEASGETGETSSGASAEIAAAAGAIDVSAGADEPGDSDTHDGDGASNDGTAAHHDARRRGSSASGTREASDRAHREPVGAAHESAARAETETDHEAHGPSTTLDISQGQVAITARGGWAEVFHGSRRLGRTPLRVHLPVGQQELRLVPYGRGPGRTVTVPVEWGQINAIDFEVGPPPSDAPASDEGS